MKLPIAIAVLLSSAAGLAAQSTDSTDGSATQTSEIVVQHLSVASALDFAATVERFEAQLGVFDPAAISSVATATPDELRQIRAKVEAMTGSSGLMRFGRVESHGLLLPLAGQPAGKAVQYLIGNPLVAVEMTRYNLAAGLYAPLRVMIYEDAQGTIRLEYDLPSSLFRQFRQPGIDTVAVELDAKMAALVRQASGR